MKNFEPVQFTQEEGMQRPTVADEIIAGQLPHMPQSPEQKHDRIVAGAINMYREGELSNEQGDLIHLRIPKHIADIFDYSLIDEIEHQQQAEKTITVNK